MSNVVISSAARTAIGSYGKSLKDVPPTELGRIAAEAAIDRAGIAPEDVGHVVFGNVIHTEPQGLLTLWDGAIGWRQNEDRTGLSISAGVTNLFDDTYVSSCSDANSCFYGERRKAMISATYKW